MKSVTPTELRGNLCNLLDEVLNTGIPLEIDRGGRRLRIIPVVDKLQNLVSRPDVIFCSCSISFNILAFYASRHFGKVLFGA